MTISKVKTKSGIVSGSSEGEFTIFKGVPYAAPPVGKLRLCPPVDLTPWQGERTCLEWPPFSIQIKRMGPPKPGEPVTWTGSEDCLYLNIWTPARTPDEKLPVVFWVHGGGFNGGGSYGRDIDGAAWSKRGVILVSVGYRLGSLGFFGLKELMVRDEHGSTGNYGLMDIFKALQWVRENFAAFGGDPENVTIAGQSSGSMTVRWLIGCKPAVGLFQHAIAQSGGGTWDVDPILPVEEKCANSQKVLDMAGWTLEDVFTRDAVEVSSILKSFVPRLGLPRKSIVAELFQPSMDGWLVTDYYGKKLFEGAGADVDVMVGTIRDEWQNFTYQVPGGIDGYEYEFAIALSVAWARRYTYLGKKPVHTYFFDHDLPDEFGVPGKPLHDSEMQFTFGTFERNPQKWTDFDRLMAEAVLDYWTNFAKTGDPNTPGRALWLPYTAEHPVTMHFSNDGWQGDHLDGRERLDKVVKFLLEKPGILDRSFFK
jgi:para-nitrobenzyl esterase